MIVGKEYIGVSEQILNSTSAELYSYTALFMLVHAGKYRTEVKSKTHY